MAAEAEQWILVPTRAETRARTQCDIHNVPLYDNVQRNTAVPVTCACALHIVQFTKIKQHCSNDNEHKSSQLENFSADWCNVV